MNASFRQGAREGFHAFLPVSVGIIPWAVVTGVAMRASGMSEVEAMAMNIIVFAGTAQLGALPLLVAGAPLWLIAVTTFALNLRFVIFSAAIAPAFQGYSITRRLLSGYILVDGVFAVCAERLLKSDDPHWRWGYYIAGVITSRRRCGAGRSGSSSAPSGRSGRARSRRIGRSSS